jgi:UDP-2,3-diacylglucosamine pyrophosphatase LpxH
MIVFVSDMHFRDEAEWTVNEQATKGFIKQNLIPLIRDAKAKEVTVVFLGDIVDIDRSPFWVDSPPHGYTPWSHWREAVDKANGGVGSQDQEFEKCILEVLDRIHKANRKNYRFWERFKKMDRAIWGRGYRPRRIRFEYIPGNHDRLSQYSKETRRRLIEHLCLDQDAREEFSYVKYDKAHRVLSLHGHVFTPMDFGRRFEQPDDYANSDWYMVPSLGNVANLIFGVRLYHDFKDDPQTREILAQVDLVRPQRAIFKWLESKFKENPDIQGEVDALLERLARDFISDPFVRWRLKWWENWLAWVLLSLGMAKIVTRLGWLFKFLRLGEPSKEKYTEEMIKKITAGEFPEWVAIHHPDMPEPNIVSGHTHDPLVVPIKGDRKGDPFASAHYFNTGSWLDTIEEDRKGGYARRHQVTHVTFYKNGEEKKPNGTRTYWEYWDGCQK